MPPIQKSALFSDFARLVGGENSDDEVVQFWEAHAEELMNHVDWAMANPDAIGVPVLEHLFEASKRSIMCAMMWNDVQCRNALLHACQHTDPHTQAARNYAMGALINIADESGLVEGMWRHATCHRAVRDACMEESTTVSEDAVWLLSNLMSSKFCVIEFWADTALRQAVIAHAAASSDVQVRVRAVECVARTARYQPEVWWIAESRRAILDASKVRDPSSLCIAEWAMYALQQLSEHPLEDSMWDDLECRQCLVDAANFSGGDTSYPRRNALWALRNLATRSRIRAEMVLEAGVLQSVTTACHSESEAVQRNAIKLLVQLTSSITTFIVWATTASVLAPLLDRDALHFVHVLELLAVLARDPFVAADMVAKFPTIPALADEATTLAGDDNSGVRELARALRAVLPQPFPHPPTHIPQTSFAEDVSARTIEADFLPFGAAEVAREDIPLAELPSDHVPGKLQTEQRVAAIEEWVSEVALVIKSNQRAVDTEIMTTMSEYNQSLAAAVKSYQTEVDQLMVHLRRQIGKAARTKGCRMRKVTKASTKLDQQRTELGEAKASLEEAQALLALFKESRAQSKRKATDAPEPATPTVKRGRSDELTPPSSAAGPATRERPAYHFCSITHEVMVDPVVAADGVSYERSAITEWLTKSNLSPMHGSELSCSTLHTNQVLKQLITEWRD
eukprot:m.73509 g.73509  ORF g.73509 m.73509 type:complete len:681 (-) comp10232_c0_seq2:158-2200(-)